MRKIIVLELVGKNAISMQNGDKLYNAIYTDVLNGESVELDFNGINLFASPFFNASIGLLLKDVTIDALKKQLSFTNLNDIGRDLLNHVIGNALEYYKHSEGVTKAIDSGTTSGDK
ncbi:STAS-like domain-containing protein [Vibrio vulnificus]|uniref:STAS-like domain-containing protein n=1 Tax=Vibrio vulnificus TaxID=672 RepID=UPI00102895A6|nr:STAS-like domain-containing protein [Vibrio vulnificus]RZR29848.1 DUF4325 domain-containing protein [Vibrio vulnificus]